MEKLRILSIDGGIFAEFENATAGIEDGIITVVNNETNKQIGQFFLGHIAGWRVSL